MENKIALVTGANSGIGKAAAAALAAKGATVILTARREEQGMQAANEIRSAGGKAEFMKLDVSSEENVREVIRAIADKYGRLDLAVNNAGIAQQPTPLTEMDAGLFQTMLQTNVMGVFLSMKHELQQMMSNGGGRIVNVSSINGVKAMATAAAYTATKFAIEGLTRSAALEMAAHSIRINAVGPGPTKTELTAGLGEDYQAHLASLIPMKRMAATEEVTNGILWLLSDEASFVTGTTLMIDGGYTA